MQRNHRTRGPRKGKKKRPPRSSSSVPGRGRRGTHTIVRSVERICPDEMEVVLTYPQTFALTVAGVVLAKRFTPNAAYDVDPNLGSTSTPGFAEWAALYTFYRVTGYRVVSEVRTLETFPVSVFSINTNIDPGTSGSNYQNYATEPYCKWKVIGPASGANGCRFVHNVDCAKLLGSESIEQADSLRAVTSANPADLLWYGIGVQSTTGSNLTAGTYVTMFIEMRVRFYARRDTLLSFLAPAVEKLNTERLLNKALEKKP